MRFCRSIIDERDGHRLSSLVLRQWGLEGMEILIKVGREFGLDVRKMLSRNAFATLTAPTELKSGQYTTYDGKGVNIMTMNEIGAYGGLNIQQRRPRPNQPQSIDISRYGYEQGGRCDDSSSSSAAERVDKATIDSMKQEILRMNQQEEELIKRREKIESEMSYLLQKYNFYEEDYDHRNDHSYHRINTSSVNSNIVRGRRLIQENDDDFRRITDTNIQEEFWC